jgi:hypothetical protein
MAPASLASAAPQQLRCSAPRAPAWSGSVHCPTAPTLLAPRAPAGWRLPARRLPLRPWRRGRLRRPAMRREWARRARVRRPPAPWHLWFGFGGDDEQYNAAWLGAWRWHTCCIRCDPAAQAVGLRPTQRLTLTPCEAATKQRHAMQTRRALHLVSRASRTAPGDAHQCSPAAPTVEVDLGALALAAQVAQRKVAAVQQVDHARQRAQPVPVRVGDRVAGRGALLKLQAPELLLDAVQVVELGDRLLADVAALVWCGSRGCARDAYICCGALRESCTTHRRGPQECARRGAAIS